MDVERFFEAILKGILWRCYFIQWTALILGVALVLERPTLELADLLENRRLLVKIMAWVAIMAVHNYIYLLVQPRIARLLEAAGDGPLAGETAARVARLRTRRKRGATMCLFLVLLAVIMAPQILATFAAGVTAGLTAFAALFALGVYWRGARFGWV